MRTSITHTAWICVTSFVLRVMSEAVENLSISADENESTFRNTRARSDADRELHLLRGLGAHDCDRQCGHRILGPIPAIGLERLRARDHDARRKRVDELFMLEGDKP